MKCSRVLSVLLPVSLLAMLASCAPTASDPGGTDRYRAFIDTALNKRADYHRTNSGYTRVDGVTKVGLLKSGDSTTLDVTLNLDRSYRLVGVCDQQCADMDMKLYNSSGALVDEDTSTDDIPLVDASPRVSGSYTLKVTMASCSNATYGCYYGVTLLRK